VADEPGLARVLAEARARFGRIDGVFHSAGVAGGGMMAVRGDDEAAAVLSAKVDGTLALYRLLGDEPDFFVLFSSIVAVTGAFGQVDYCAANNFMDAFARWAVQRGRPVCSIGWDGWVEFGMAADTDADAPEVFRRLESGARSIASAHPLLDGRMTGGEEALFTSTLEPGKHWITDEHRIGGREVVVGTALMEMVDGAYRELTGDPAELVDVLYFKPIGVDRPTEVRLSMRPDAGAYAVTVVAAEVGPEPRRWAEYMRCRVEPLVPEPPRTHDLAAIAARCERAVSAEALAEPSVFVQRGAHWEEAVKSIAVGPEDELARVELAEAYWAETGQYRMHPALVDIAIGPSRDDTGRLARGDDYLPLGYERVRVPDALPPAFWVHRRSSADGADVVTSDLVLIDDDGTEIGRILGYTERKVDAATIHTTLAGGQPAAGDGQPAAGDGRPAAGGGQSAAGAAGQGAGPHAPRHPATAVVRSSITADLGLDVLGRIVYRRPAPHVIVCPHGLPAALRRAEALTLDVVERELAGTNVAVSTGQDRLVDTPYVAPENHLQRVIAGLMGGSLGVTDVGIDDDFFDLGGNSLVAVQVAARMRESLGTGLGIAALFDHPTVRSLAAHLQQELTTPGAGR